jgi:putative flavoprotein involved in K+ transport
MNTPDVSECIVVGAGPAGLAMSEALAERAISHRVLERGQIGNSWRTQRWAGLRLNSPGWLNRALHGDGDDFPTAGWAVERMAEMAHRLPVETGVPVLQLSRADDGFDLTTPGGRRRARTVVVATGDANVPKVPQLAAELPSRLIQLPPPTTSRRTTCPPERCWWSAAASPAHRSPKSSSTPGGK